MRRPHFVSLTPVLFVLATLFMLNTVAIPDSAHAQRKILNIGHIEPDTLDPHTSILGQTQAIVRFLYRGLTRFKITPDGKVTTAEVEPDMAESWTSNDDGTVWTFKLRKGIQWHKGFGEFTAEDVKFSIERVQDRSLKGNKFAKNLEIIKDVTVLDKYTVQITLHTYDPVFSLRLVGYQQGYMLSKKAVQKFGDDYAWNPVGTGPFYFERHVPRDRVVLRAHKDYYFGRPQIDEVRWFDVPEDATKLIGLEKGTFDLIVPNVFTAEVVDQVERLGMVIDKRGPGSQQRFYINYTKPPFDDIRVRQAFMHGIDRQAIVDILYPKGLAKVSPSPLPPGYFGHIPVEVPEYNPDRARQLLKEAGYPNGIAIRNYYITRSYFYPKVMVIVQEQLKKVGFDIEIQMVEHATYHEYIRKNLNPFVLYGGTRLTDGDIWLGLFFHSSEAPDPETGNTGTNFAHYKGIDDLIDQGRQERNPDKRAKLYHEAQRRIMADAVCLPILDTPSMTVRNPKRVTTPFDPEYGEFALHYIYNYPEMLALKD
ncbi:MAG TPA: ABC transporter substrate-binding protein [Alphaproteobacteria bacterium]|nr:ABC transporter substrate-binding protein [Alphaproteobacteria bacterium]